MERNRPTGSSRNSVIVLLLNHEFVSCFGNGRKTVSNASIRAKPASVCIFSYIAKLDLSRCVCTVARGRHRPVYVVLVLFVPFLQELIQIFLL